MFFGFPFKSGQAIRSTKKLALMNFKWVKDA